MVDDVEIRVTLPMPAKAAMEQWRTNPPQPVKDARLSLVDRTLETLMYEASYQDGNMRFMNAFRFMSFGLAPKVEAFWRLTVRFDPDGETRCLVTAIGKIPAETRTALGAWAQQNGVVATAFGVA